MRRTRIIKLMGLSSAACFAHLLMAQVPGYRFDPTWPELPLPNKWWLQQVVGLDVDHLDTIWVLNRPGTITENQNYAQLTPPTADCCVAPPAIIAFDQAGNVIHSWNPDLPRFHGLAVDSEGYVWIGSDTVYKFTREGELVDSIGRVPDTPAPERGYPPDTELVVDQIEEIKIDEQAREIYYVDNYLNGRVMIHDLDTLQFKRGWGAYGKPLSAISPRAPEMTYDVNGPPARDFLGHVTLGISNDGRVYVADRAGNRIQVFTKAGEMMDEFSVAPETLHRGAAGGIAFSSDPDQRHLLVPDFQNNTVWILDREDGEVLGRVSSAGDFGGQFSGLHMADTDSSGNLYTGEVFLGRVQRFSPVN